MQVCPDCGLQNNDTARFCNRCGSRLSTALVPGDMLQGRYKIVQRLGQGGMGAVYRAEDTRLGNRAVAVKENFDASREAQAQFQLEANTLAGLSHPNLPRVIDHFVEPSGKQYLVMDYIDGQDLQQKLAVQGPLSELDVLAWIAQVGEALTYLHGCNPPIIHRDVKPSNIKIASDGRAVLVDFGIAKQFRPGQKTAMAARAVTPGFSPPEQYGGSITDARSDVYALGATMYALVTGQAPPDALELLAHQVTLPTPRYMNGRVSPGVEAAILHAMDLDPARRPQSVAEFLGMLSISSQPRGVGIPASVPAGPAPATRPISTPPQSYPPVAPPQPVSTPPPRGNAIASAELDWAVSPNAINRPPSAPPIVPPAPQSWSPPTPAYAYGNYATFLQRVVASIIDGVLVGLGLGVLAIVAGLFSSEFITVILTLLGLYFSIWYYVNAHGTTGQTIGKRAMGIRVVATDGSRISRKRAFARLLVSMVETGMAYVLVGFLGYLWMLWDPNKQTWHDKIASTYVVQV